MSKKNINQLICGYLLGKSSAEESAQLEKWLQADPSHQEFINQLSEKKEFSNLFRKYIAIDEEQAWQMFEQQTVLPKRRLITLSPRFYRIAAAILILLVGGAFWYHREYTRVTPPVITEEVQLAMEQSRESGRAGRILSHLLLHVSRLSVRKSATYTMGMKVLSSSWRRRSASPPAMIRNTG